MSKLTAVGRTPGKNMYTCHDSYFKKVMDGQSMEEPTGVGSHRNLQEELPEVLPEGLNPHDLQDTRAHAEADGSSPPPTIWASSRN